MLQPGENASCVGCHESKNSVPLAQARPTQALAAGAQKLAEIGGPSRGFSFAREVQPILDRRCVACHDGKEAKRPDLTGAPVADAAAKRVWSRAYLALTHARPDHPEEKTRWRGDPGNRVVCWVSAASAPTVQKPCSAGSRVSELFKKLDAGHCKTVTPEEVAVLAAWVDLGVPFCGDYEEAGAWSEAERQKYASFREKRQKYAAADLASLRALAEAQEKSHGE